MSDYLSLEEAAAKLGIPTERLVDLRSQGQVRGFRDGASWKFPEAEVDRLSEELADAGAGSGILADDSGVSLSGGSGSIIGGDEPVEGGSGSGSDLGIGSEKLTPGSDGSDVNLVASDSDGSDVALVAGSDDPSDSSAKLPDGLEVSEDLQEIDSAELKLEDPAITHDSAEIDLAIEPKEGSTGPVTQKSDGGKGSKAESDLSLSASMLEEDSDDLVLGDDDSSGMDMLGSDLELSSEDATTGKKASSLELLDELNEPSADSESGSLMSSGADVLSELDLLGAEQGGSGLISGDSENLLKSSGLGEGLDSKDDALADDDDLVISDDDDDLVIESHGSDISIAGDSGINLMSPSDSGLSLESEPLDLAGSSISALDLGAELAEDGSDVGSDPAAGSGVGSGVDFQSDEEFQLSPSGVGLEADIDSGSQVIEVEDSEAIGEAVEFEDGGFAEAGGGDVFAAEPAAEEPMGEAVAFDESDAGAAIAGTTAGVAAGGGGYEVPFTTLQCVSLAMIMSVMALCGMLMTDLIRNMWTYSEPAAPVSSLTGWLIDLMGW